MQFIKIKTLGSKIHFVQVLTKMGKLCREEEIQLYLHLVVKKRFLHFPSVANLNFVHDLLIHFTQSFFNQLRSSRLIKADMIFSR